MPDERTSNKASPIPLNDAIIATYITIHMLAPNAPAHLAGAMGKPVWILLPPAIGDWESVIRPVDDELRVFRPIINANLSGRRTA
jgi:hypothetical protein